MQIAQLFFHNSILIASRTADFWCFLKELAGLHRILIGFCDLFCKILLKREKTARIIQKAAQKTGSTILSPACFDMFEPSKTFFMFLFVIPVNRVPTLHSFDWKEKNSKNHPESCIQKQAARFLSPACFGNVWAIKGFFHVSFYDASESSRQPLQSKSECQRPTLSSSSCLPISCCPSSPSMPSPEIGQLLSGKTTAAAESSY